MRDALCATIGTGHSHPYVALTATSRGLRADLDFEQFAFSLQASLAFHHTARLLVIEGLEHIWRGRPTARVRPSLTSFHVEQRLYFH